MSEHSNQYKQEENGNSNNRYLRKHIIDQVNRIKTDIIIMTGLRLL